MRVISDKLLPEALTRYNSQTGVKGLYLLTTNAAPLKHKLNKN